MLHIMKFKTMANVMRCRMTWCRNIIHHDNQLLEMEQFLGTNSDCGIANVNIGTAVRK